MNLYILTQYKLIQQLYKDESYLDALINIEDFFDILGLYVFPNWIDCEVVDLKFMKYFTNIKLKSKYKKMPHPKGSILLLKYGCDVKYIKTTEYLPKDDINDQMDNSNESNKKSKIKKQKVWIIDILIPNKHIFTDNVYDIKSIQDKLDMENEENQDLNSDINDENNNSDQNQAF